MVGVYRLSASTCDGVICIGVVDLEEAEEGSRLEVIQFVMAGVFRPIDDVQSSSVVFPVTFCGMWVDEFVLWGMNGNGHDV